MGVTYAFVIYGVSAGLERCILISIIFLGGMLFLVGMGDLKLMMAIGALNGTLCLAVTTLLAAIGVLLIDRIKHRRYFWMDMKAGLRSILSMQFKSEFGTGRKVKFAPYLLCGLIGGIIACGIF